MEALLDTGFDGHVALPAGALTVADGYVRWTLADESSVLAPYYLGAVEVSGLGLFDCVVTALGAEPLVGCGVASHLTITLVHARTLTVEP